jgi:DNA-binding MarR family transcriptional regulator
MKETAEKEIAMLKPFVTDAEKLFVSVQLTAEAQRTKVAELFREGDLTVAQYNVLRILRGAGDEGLPCREIGERLVTRDPDITRLLDRLEARGLIRRERPAEDRRTVLVFVTGEGSAKVAEFDGPLAGLHAELFRGLTRAEKKQLGGLLRKLR